MKSKVTKQRKYLFKQHAKNLAGQDELIVYILMPILTIMSFAVKAKVLKGILHFDRVNRFDFINLYTHVKVFLLFLMMGLVMCYILYRVLTYEVMPRLDYISIGVGVIVTLAVLSSLLSSVKENWWWGSFDRSSGLLAYASLYLLMYGLSQISLSKKSIRYISYFVNLVVIVMVAIGIFQFFGYHIAESKFFETIVTPKNMKLTLTTTKIPFRGTKYFIAESMLQNPNYFGAFCVIYFPFILNFALKERNLIRKAYYYIGALLTIVGITMAQAFASIITLICIIPVILIIAVNRKNIIEFVLFAGLSSYIVYKVNEATTGLALAETYSFLKRILDHRLGKPFLITGIVVILLLMLLRPLLKKYSSIFIKFLSIAAVILGIVGFTLFLNYVVPNNKFMFSQRGYIWHYTQEIIDKNPLIGTGPDRYYYEFPQDAEKDIYQKDVVNDKPHNMYLQYITDIGFIGLTAFFVLILGLCWMIANTLKANKSREVYIYLTGILMLLITYLIQGIGNDNMVAIQVMLWPVLAFAMSLSNNGTTKEITDKNGTFDD